MRLMSIAFFCLFSMQLQSQQVMSCNQWKEDILFLQKKLEERHVNIYHTISKEAFNTKVTQLVQAACTLDERSLIVRLSELVASVQDAHTYLSIRQRSKWVFKKLPIEVELFYDGVFITHADKKYVSLIGEKIIAINDIPISQVLHKIKGVGYRENEMTEMGSVPVWLMYPDVLKTFGIAKSTDSIKIQTNNKAYILPAYRPDSLQLISFLDNKKDIPDYTSKKDSIYWYKHFPAQSALYAQVNLMRQDKDHTFKDLSDKITSFVNQFQPKKLVLDLRFNVGGNSKLAYPLIYALMHYERTVPDGKLFVITSRRTLSASIVVSDEINKFTNAIFVGEPTGAAPNLYGENTYDLTLPNSALWISYSSAYFQSAGPFVRDKWIAPRLSIKMNSDDYFTLKDPMLDAIWKYKDIPVWNNIFDAAMTGDTSKAKAIYRSFKADPVNEYVDTEADTRRLGNRLLAAGKIDEGEMIFKLNIAAYPERATPYISLAQLYKQQENRQAAADSNFLQAKKLLPNDNTINAYFKHNLTDLVDNALKPPVTKK
jgi:hypothetical protein